ncbi:MULTISPECIES: hypothetical protein [Streptosporangium]|uniref:Uncharacterized protein n=1 Tax=Streptosporangium brasiliense TaxID=47480 RepID=A0ABT9RIC1_9ACTN|nr:hypothetical protein [Streptosporangium brasiliense]
MVEYRLGGSCRTVVHTLRDEHGENAVTAADSAPDDLAVVGEAGKDRDPPGELIELVDAALPAHADHLVAAVQRVPYQVAPEIVRGPATHTFRGFSRC